MSHSVEDLQFIILQQNHAHNILRDRCTRLEHALRVIAEIPHMYPDADAYLATATAETALKRLSEVESSSLQ